MIPMPVAVLGVVIPYEAAIASVQPSVGKSSVAKTVQKSSKIFAGAECYSLGEEVKCNHTVHM
jgi:hypothetical protein